VLLIKCIALHYGMWPVGGSVLFELVGVILFI